MSMHHLSENTTQIDVSANVSMECRLYPVIKYTLVNRLPSASNSAVFHCTNVNGLAVLCSSIREEVMSSSLEEDWNVLK